MKHPKKGEVTSVGEGHDVQVTMSVVVQLASGIDESAPHVIVIAVTSCT